MSERSASLRKRPAAVVATEDNGSRAKRAASAFLLAGGGNIRDVADEYGVECAHVHYYVNKWKGTGMQEYFESSKQAEEVSTPRSIATSTGSSECPEWHLLSYHARRKWAIKEGARLV